MNYDFYKTFVILAETRNFSKAAKKLNIVQSTVSNRIGELEKYLQVPLFNRTNKNVELTQFGTNFLPYAKRVIAIEEEGISHLHKYNYKNTIKIGAVHSLYYRYVEKITKSFMGTNHDTSVKVVINHSNILMEMLEDNLIDIGFVYQKPKSTKLHCIGTFSDDFILVTKNSPEFLDTISLEQLPTLNLLLADLGNDFHQWLETKLKRKLDYRLYVDQMLELVDFLYEGFGYAFMLRSLTKDLIFEGKLKEVKINNYSPYIVNGYVFVDKSKIKNPSVDSYTKHIIDII
ncbi:LysR family transcriptional regulator [Clostridium cellulovorans]|uniref:Transcriptional regulator, LysR family n=1 Tax=Clostridium cellulovorans (strain ATCC 35296 / DSM 3052 / OCM 3 / 743B) TaxID=573061 RepID=D9SW13_CLOC7|nr:LysR family transcriptional regulator [Clostridium cellulovorans]ADL51157.1 transcriptional regulator, LysR family [Clostridium cellulovorans 743B]